MKIVVNAMEMGNEMDFSIKGDFQHLVETGVLQQFVSQLQDKMLEIDQSGLTTLIKNAHDQDKMYLTILPQDLRSKLLKTYNTLKNKGEDDLAENIEALACHFMNLEQALMTEKSHVTFMEQMRSLPVYQGPYPGSCNGYDPNYGPIYSQMRPMSNIVSVSSYFNNNPYNLNPWYGSPVEQFKMKAFFQEIVSEYLPYLFNLENKDIEVKYYIAKTMYEIRRVEEIIMDFYAGNDRFETIREDLEGIFEIIFYCNKQLRSLRPDDDILELKKEVFDKFIADLENTFVQLIK